MYKHYLITRFNLVLNNPMFESDKSGRSVQTESWLAGRFDLFDNYTIPSIKNQRCKDFTWLVLFDIDTPEKYRAKIAAYADDVPQFLPLYVASGFDVDGSLAEYIRKDSSEEFVITSRVDSDDLLHRDYIGLIQDRFVPLDNTFMTFRRGVQYTEETSIMRDYNYIKNHYATRLERRESVSTVMCNHTTIHKLGNLKIYSDRYMWIEILHRGNLRNYEKKLPMIYIENTLDKYGVELPHNRVNRFSWSYIKSLFYYLGKSSAESLRVGLRQMR